MEILYENLEVLCEDLGGGEWEVEYSVRPLLHLLDGLTPPPPSSSSLIVVLLSAITLLRLGLVRDGTLHRKPRCALEPDRASNFMSILPVYSTTVP